MNKLAICNMCYLDEYTCAFRDYYYKGIYTPEESPGIRQLYFTKLPTPFSEKVTKAWNEANTQDTLGAHLVSEHRIKTNKKIIIIVGIKLK